MTERDAKQQLAYELGYEHGKNAGAWVIDGNTSDETKACIRQGIMDIDPEYMDMLPDSPLSGVWADGMTIGDVFEQVGHEPREDYEQGVDDWYSDQLLDLYECGFSQGVEDQVMLDTIDN